MKVRKKPQVRNARAGRLTVRAAASVLVCLLLFSVLPLSGGALREIRPLFGDADGNGDVNGADLMLLRGYLASRDYPAAAADLSGSVGMDADGDGSVGAADLMLMRVYIADMNYWTGVSSVKLGQLYHPALLLDAEELNLEPVYHSGGDGVAAVTDCAPEMRSGKLRRTYSLRGIAPGSAEISFVNNYGEKARVRVLVDDSLCVSAEVIPFEAPVRSYNVRNYGAIADGSSDATAAIQSCIDLASASGGGTVYVPAGSYRISTLCMKPGVELRFAGVLPDLSGGYTDAVKNRVSGSDYAVVRTTGKSVSNIFIYNLVPRAYCTEGCSDFSVSGGMFDCQAKMKFAAVACGSDITFENIVVKDLPNNHGFQIDGCRNVTLDRIMFAGYDYPASNPVLTRETIQIEPTAPGALSSNLDTTPIICSDGDYYHNYDVAVTNCYFGKSDKYGSQLVAVGHHSTSGALACDGLLFEGNVVDNPRYCGLHLLDMINVTVRGNRFISEGAASSAAMADDTALISLYMKSENKRYTDASGNSVYYCINYELPGCRNYRIEDNEFTVGDGTFLRAVTLNGISTAWNNEWIKYQKDSKIRNAGYGSETFTLDGYLYKCNRISNVRLQGNSFSVLSAPAYDDCYFSARYVSGLFLGENSTSLFDVSAFSVSYQGRNGFSVDENTVVGANGLIREVPLSSSSVRSVTVVENGRSLTVPKPSSAITLTLKSDGNGWIEFETDAYGNLTILPVPCEGFRFAGWKDASGTMRSLSSVRASETLTAIFTQ